MPPKRTMSAKGRVGLVQPKGRRGRIGAAIPPASAAPPGFAPITTSASQGALAPWPLIDRFPNVVGQSLSFSYLSSVLRLCTTGYRQQYVDLLGELLECDPHLYSVVVKRILSTAVGRLDIRPFDVPEDHPLYEKAQEAAELCQREVARIPDLTQNLQALLWAIYTGVSASEIYWTRDGAGWHPERLQFVHTRRLSYPDSQSWDLFIWDQGQVYGWNSKASATANGYFGLRVKDYPGKFITHAPQLRGEYPTRDGLGRELSYWTLLKRIGARGASEYLERFAKGFIDVTYATGADGKPRLAEDADIELAKELAARIGPGSGSFAVHGDCITLSPKGYEGTGTAKITWEQWISLCNAEMSKATLGGTINTDHRGGGGLGGKGVADSQERGEVSLEQYDGSCLAETIRRDLLWWIVKLNRPDCIDVVPTADIHVETDPDPKSLIEAAKGMTAIGAPVDLDELSEQTGIPLIENTSGKPRRSFMSNSVDPTLVDPTLENEQVRDQRAKAEEASKVLAAAGTQSGADPKMLAEVAKILTSIDVPLDARKVGAQCGMPVIAKGAKALLEHGRTRILTGGKDAPIVPEAGEDPNDPSGESPSGEEDEPVEPTADNTPATTRAEAATEPDDQTGRPSGAHKELPR